jgi:hypothetical protein
MVLAEYRALQHLKPDALPPDYHVPTVEGGQGIGFFHLVDFLDRVGASFRNERLGFIDAVLQKGVGPQNVENGLLALLLSLERSNIRDYGTDKIYDALQLSNMKSRRAGILIDLT